MSDADVIRRALELDPRTVTRIRREVNAEALAALAALEAKRDELLHCRAASSPPSKEQP